MSFENLYRNHYNEIRIFVFRMLLDEDIVQDIIQETFLKLHLQLNKNNKNLLNPRAWLFKVAYNLSINFLKGIKKNCGLIADDELLINSVEDDFTIKETKKQIRSAIKKLESRDRALVMLYKEGFSYTEMAEILEMNSNSVGKTLARAIDKLKKELKGELYEMPG